MAYHPAVNCMVKRFHRILKIAIKCYKTELWMELLPSILFGIRSCVKKDLNVKSSKIVYGTTLRLPGEFFELSKGVLNPTSLVIKIKIIINLIIHYSNRKVFIYTDLVTCSRVFLKKDRLIKSLEPPYESPFKIMTREDKNLGLKMGDKIITVSIDRVKPCFNVSMD